MNNDTSKVNAKTKKQRNETSPPEITQTKTTTKPKTQYWYIEAAPMHMEAEHMARQSTPKHGSRTRGEGQIRSSEDRGSQLQLYLGWSS